MNENAVNCLSARDKMRSYLKHPGSFVLMLLVMLAALVTFAVLIFLIIYILVNGLPLVHIELKRRGVPIREAFNQINRYQRDSFWAGSGLFFRR